MHSSLYILASGVLAVGLLVLLIAKAKLHPFIALLISTLLLGLANGLGPTKTVETVTDNFGSTLSVTGLVIAMGTVLGGLLLNSGGADRIADVLVGNRAAVWMPLSIGLAAVIIGLPNLFEVTFVLLVPLVFSVARKYNRNLLAVGLPMAAGLMTSHALLPPGPATVMAAQAYDASLGVTILYGILVGVPVLLVGALLFPRLIARWNITGNNGALELLGDSGGSGGTPAGPAGSPDKDGQAKGTDTGTNTGTGTGTGGTALAVRSEVKAPATPQPTLAACLSTVLVAPLMMIVGTLLPDALPDHGWYSPVLDAIGNPVIALLVSVLYAYWALGIRLGSNGAQLLANTKKGLTPVISLLLIIGAGGALKGMLNGIGLSDIIADNTQSWSISPILFAWLIAAIFRIALGSGTVAVAAATGIITPVLAQHPGTPVELIVLATCTGAMIFSHVSDGAFWIFKEYFGLTVPETLKTWSLLVTVQAVVGLVSILIVDAVVQLV
ncbi:GntP family permease [Streptomyces kunmingensis]|uniref:GntP family permease n=1 Tax=Streptomyces kunmingensis TaxID=68225 RepID=A0ABU6C678_9ACTN|nr:SLC13 family permease [Streptomyces kunmingensis]MEB3960224.1 GntP family permease [Streptomyces kunmingensis]